MPWLDYAPELVRLMEAEAQRIEKTTPEQVAWLDRQLVPGQCLATARYGITEMHAYAARAPSEPARLRREAAEILRIAWGAKEDDGSF